jgi:probable biosynthetic protein (TIGR04098 family)
MASWNDYRAQVTMPLMAPGEKLSEVEFLKLLGACQWESISRLLGVPLQNIVSEQNERLYGSVINVELDFGAAHGQERFGEGAPLFVRNRIGVYAQRFVEGLFLFDDEEIPDAELEPIATLDELRAQRRPHAYFTNAFIVRAGGNAKLKVFRPRGIESVSEALATEPTGIREHARVQASGDVAPFDPMPEALPLTPLRDEPIRYQIMPETDLNGAGLLYFARYVAMTTYAERVFLEQHLAPPLSNPLAEALSTDRRRIFFFANATGKDVVEIALEASVILPEHFPPQTTPARYRTPFKLLFRADLYRSSDKTLMASSLVQRSLNVPASAKAVLTEADRFLRRLRTGSR